jgi:probable HAF family extracellular repeat protein
MQVSIRPEALEPRRLMAAYSVVDLGALGGSDSVAYNLNDQNQVVGFALNAAGQHRAFVFADTNNNRQADPGEMRDLGVLPGHTASYAYGINNAGQIIGTSRTLPTPDDADERAVRFNPGAAPADLGLGDGSNANDIGPGGEIVGGLIAGIDYHAFVRAASGAVTTFALPSPYNEYSEARAVAVGANGATYVAGYSGGLSGDSGFLRTADGSVLPVGHAAPAQPYGYAWDVNANGAVVGEGFNAANQYHAFLWQNGATTDLGTLPGYDSSSALGINDRGEIVGRVEPPEGTPGTTRAFVYSRGVMRDLNTLIPPNSGYLITEARAVNNSGAIAAFGFNPAGATRGFLLLPNAPVAGRYVFYNNSAYDGFNRAANAADDNAIAPDKTPATGAASRSFANITNYSRGINGIMIDVAGFETPSAADFSLRVGGGSTSTWAPAPAPGVTVRPGAGASGSDRVTFTWNDGAIRNTWLEVTVRANGTTGLWTPDVFYVGNLAGETSDAASALVQTVGGRDVLSTRARMGARNVSITHPNDFNRDRRVDSQDYAIVRQNVGRSLSTTVPTAAGTAASSTLRLAASRRTELLEVLA